jgi:hypothetical protein
MRERPIIFNTPMVKAILEGRKTQTRRVVKIPDWWECHFNYSKNNTQLISRDGGKLYYCPYGQARDLLYVRETFALVGFYEKPVFKADRIKSPIGGFHFKWKPSIHMPKEYARIWLEITDIGVERLQDIDEIDAEAEGIFVDALHDLKSFMYPHREYFKMLWDSTTKKHPWESNPWVWVIEFKKTGTT